MKVELLSMSRQLPPNIIWSMITCAMPERICRSSRVWSPSKYTKILVPTIRVRPPMLFSPSMPSMPMLLCRKSVSEL